MQLRRYTGYLFLCLCCPLWSIAQQQRSDADTIIPDQTIEIIQSYKPEVAMPEKPEWTPRLNIIDTAKPVFSYEVPQQVLSYTYHSIPIRPLAMGRIPVKMPFANYVKLGLGNLNTFLLDAGLSISRPESYEAALHFNHLSQKGNIDYQQSSGTSVQADGKYYFSGHAASAALIVAQQSVHFYGYDHNNFDYVKRDLHQAFLKTAVRAGISNTRANNWQLWYQPEIELGTYGDRFGASEQHFDFNIPVRWQIDSALNLSLAVTGSVTQLNNDSFSTSNPLFQIKPALNFRLPVLNLNIGVNPTWGKDGKTYLMPDIFLKLHKANGKFAFVAGWKSGMMQNTFEQLSTKNPFLYNIYPLKQTRHHQVFGGFEAGLSKRLHWNATFSWQQWNNMALFVNDYLQHADGKYFTVVYDDLVQALALDASLNYQVAERLKLGITAGWINFMQLDSQQKAWMEPTLKLAGELHWQVFRPFQLRVRAAYWDGMYALQSSGSKVAMPALFDLNAEATFRIISRISLFLQIDNIAGSKYQRWYQYPVYGTNVIGGLRVNF